MYVISSVIGILAVLGILLGSKGEKWLRRKKVSGHLQTRLLLMEPGQKTQYTDLWSGHYTIGRRRRRNDLALIHDPTVSREHAVLWLDRKGNFYIRPILHPSKRGKSAYYSEVKIGVNYVPAAGKQVNFDDEIWIGESKLKLEHMEEGIS